MYISKIFFVRGIFFLVLFFLLSGRTFAASFIDVSIDHPFYEAIQYTQTKGYMKGYDGNVFRPGAVLNRAELLKVAFAGWQERGIEFVPGERVACFKDVPADAWYQPYVCAAKNEGIIQGYKDNTFRPGQRVTVVEAAKILNELYALPKDETDKDFWYSSYLKSLSSKKVLPSAFEYFNQGVTRGDIAEMLWRLSFVVTSSDGEHLSGVSVANIDQLEQKKCEESPEHIPASVDMARVRETWLRWTNEARTAAGLEPYTYEPQLGRTAAVWSQKAKTLGYINHKRPGQTVYYDYSLMIAWFKDLGLTFKNVGGSTMVENIGWEYYTCNETDCTDEIIDAIHASFDFFMSEKGKAYRPHYESIMSPNYKLLGMGLALDESHHKYYLTVHYGTEISSHPDAVCPI